MPLYPIREYGIQENHSTYYVPEIRKDQREPFPKRQYDKKENGNFQQMSGPQKIFTTKTGSD